MSAVEALGPAASPAARGSNGADLARWSEDDDREPTYEEQMRDAGREHLLG